MDESNKMVKPTVLIAEDDDVAFIHLSIILKEFVKEVIRAKNGKEVVEICRNNSDIDLVLMDIKMPQFDGYDATRLIRGFNSNIIIIAETAYALSGDREKVISAGCNDYISKPIKKEVLIKLIKKYF
jgi:CheY-like chemotaxis protein